MSESTDWFKTSDWLNSEYQTIILFLQCKAITERVKVAHYAIVNLSLNHSLN